MLKRSASALLFAVFLFAGPVYSQSNFDVFEASIEQIQAALSAGEVNSEELVTQYLARIEAYDHQGPALNSLIRINPNALEQARLLDRERHSSGSRSLLHGIPIIVKDNYNTADMPTTGGSVALAAFQPGSNATQVEKLLAAGAIVLAKSNLHEFAYGITSVSSLLGQTRNPYDTRRVPGGSSGGTAAAIAASFAAVGMGSDTCGSIRIPAAFNNLIGLRPSKGLSSIWGIMPLSHTQDVAGPLARSASDLALVLDIVSGVDPRDAATGLLSAESPPGFYQQLDKVNLSGLRIARLTDYFDRADAAIRRPVDQALAWYSEQGVEVIELEIEGLDSLLASSSLIGHEFRPDLNQYLATFGATQVAGQVSTLAEILDQGLYHQAVAAALSRSVSSPASLENNTRYAEALQARQQLIELVMQTMKKQQLDALVYPPIGELQAFIGEAQGGNNCSLSANSGLPALSMPVGFTTSGLPVAMEILGPTLSDSKLLGIAYRYEQAMNTRQAPSTTPRLQSGSAPQATTIDLDWQQQGHQLSGQFSYDFSSNLFNAVLDWSGAAGTELYAAVLMIDDTDIAGLLEPVALNLAGPVAASLEPGEPVQKKIELSYFMTPEFRRALLADTLYLKLFASDLPKSGIAKSLH